ncbi:hypothetical protein QQS21_000309 [Conoideocrella luteorostrata]|uniref:Uncharacterized protein n=1 Tax=Conoideocrella luteorostrata TaxID=1105319 RepID=A0AAJ0CZ34_9HYPO|nr:hypothetical protein QQS21_000309 [Conoideocrella luteorostrata]
MRVSQFVALALTAVSTVSAVTLQQFTRPQCYGAKRLCSNIGPGICCQSKSRVFASGNCVGCTSTDFHTVWNQNGRNYCGRVASSRNGGGCTGGQNLRGHTWCRLCRTKRMVERGFEGEVLEGIQKREAEAVQNGQELHDDAECKESVEPDLVTLDDKRFFKINYAVSEADTKAILDWIEGENPEYSALSSHLMQHETQFDLYAEELGGKKE